MTVKTLHRAVRYEIDKTDSLDSVGFLPEEYDYWLNSAIINEVKSKFSGSGVSREAFEQNQKRIDDLRTLVVQTSISTTNESTKSDKPNVYKASLPSSSYWFTVGEEVDIVFKSSTEPVDSLVIGEWYKVENGDITHDGTTYNSGDYFKATTENFSTSDSGEVYECTIKREGITETTSDRYKFDYENPYNEYNLYEEDAKPLRLFREGEVHLITDGNYGVPNYYLTYLKRPQKISIDTVTSGNIEADVLYDVSVSSIDYNGDTYNPGDTFRGVDGVTSFSGTGEVRKTVDLPEHTHDEIVKEASNMMLENTGNPRYQTHSRENIKSE